LKENTLTKIIGVIQLKGGAGKSTVATNLAAMFAEKGSTLLIDCDPPQFTSECWYIEREKRGREGDLKLIRAEDEHSLGSILRNAQADYIVLDAAPRITKTSKQILAVSDLVLVPVSTAGADVWATFDTEEAIQEELAERKSLKVRLLMNRYRDYVNSAKAIKREVKKDFVVPVMNSTLGYREAYAQALGTGLCADEVGNPKATEELTKLTNEVIRLLRR
jgi:chromosome partitioning protein